MELLKYLEPMKHLPDRFSNLAFWRGVRKLKDDVVNAFEYVDSWGESVEHTLANVKEIDYTNMKNIKCKYSETTLPTSFYSIADSCVVVRGVYGVTTPELPNDFGSFGYVGCTLSCVLGGTKVASGCYCSAVFYIENGIKKMNLNTFCTYFSPADGSPIPAGTTFKVSDIYLYYYPTI